MTDLPIVVMRILAMFLVMALGWFARWRGYLHEEIGRTLSRFLVDLVFPAMVFTQMLKTIDPQAIRAGWYVPLLGLGIMVVAEIVALGTIPFFSRKEPRNTAIFLAATPNWIYLPLPIVQGLFGDAGIRDILLFNVGAQVALWTMGIWTLKAAAPDLKSIRMLFSNPGLLATLAGILVALMFPEAGAFLKNQPLRIFSPELLFSATFQAMDMLGSLTIPLSLLVTGVQLGEFKWSEHIPSRKLVGVLLTRLVLAPLVTVLIVRIVFKCGGAIGEVSRITGYLIAAMPVAISCSIVADRFSGDSGLAAKAIFYSTLLSIATVPAFFYIVKFFAL